MLRNNADVRRCSYFELGLPVLHSRSLVTFQLVHSESIGSFETRETREECRLQENENAKTLV